MTYITGASIPGSDHTMPGKPSWKNNQDASYISATDDMTIGIVADGCGSGATSEVGSFLTARLLGESLRKSVILELAQNRPFTGWVRLESRLLAQISTLVDLLGDRSSETIGETFLSSIVGFVRTEFQTTVFHLGDGTIWIDREVIQLGPFPLNAPPYLAYRLHDPKAQSLIVREFPIETKEIMIATDGIEYLPDIDATLSQLIADPRTFSNSDFLRRQIARINQERIEGGLLIPGPLRDDITIILQKGVHHGRTHSG